VDFPVSIGVERRVESSFRLEAALQKGSGPLRSDMCSVQPVISLYSARPSPLTDFYRVRRSTRLSLRGLHSLARQPTEEPPQESCS
jgi:hypothetical protein